MQKLKRIARSAAAAITGLAASLTVGVTNALAAGGGSGVNISANSSGLPGLTQSETIVGALITLGVIASVAGPGAVGDGVGGRQPLGESAGRRARQDRSARLVEQRGSVRRRDGDRQLLLQHRRADLMRSDEENREALGEVRARCRWHQHPRGVSPVVPPAA